MLRHIKTTKCFCGATAVEERVEVHNGKIRTHCNGEQWEIRKFACGIRIKWIPNFSQEFRQGYCCNDSTHQERLTTQLDFQSKMKSYIKKQAKKFGLNEKACISNFSYGLRHLENFNPRLWEGE